MATFKVMTWNIENLFRPGSESRTQGQMEFTQKLTSLANVILKLDLAVVAVQEVGGEEPFYDLSNKLEGRYPHL